MKGLSAEVDFVVVGASIAGLRAAIELAEAGRVLVVSKNDLPDLKKGDAQGEAE
jgi:L-aspartate oxidase